MIDVSIIMNTYKENPKYLKEAIEGYLNQKNINIHLIISTVENDCSIEFIKNNYNDNRIELCITKKINHTPGCEGIYTQLNNATKYIKGEWFCYASSNDVPLLDKIEKEISMCKKYNKKICYSCFYVTDDKLKIIKKKVFYPFNKIRLLKGNFVSDCSLIKSELLKKYLPFKTSNYNCGFWDLWLRIASKEGNVFIYNTNYSFYYRQTSKSAHTHRTLQQKMKYDKAKNNVRKIYSKLLT